MATTAQLREKSRQGFEPEKPDCIGLDGELSPNMHWGCGHVYDETPVDLVVYVRNDPENLVDPNGKFAVCWSIPRDEERDTPPGVDCFGGSLPDDGMKRPIKEDPDLPKKHTCVGKARILKGNSALVGKEGAFAGVAVRANSAAIIPDQFSGWSKGQLRQFIGQISGSLGDPTSGDTWFPIFTGVTDVIGGKSPIEGMNVRDALQKLYPDTLILEIPGLSRDLGVLPIVLRIPINVPCPTGTDERSTP